MTVLRTIFRRSGIPMDFNKKQEEGSRNDKGTGLASGVDRADGAAA